TPVAGHDVLSRNGASRIGSGIERIEVSRIPIFGNLNRYQFTRSPSCTAEEDFITGLVIEPVRIDRSRRALRVNRRRREHQRCTCGKGESPQPGSSRLVHHRTGGNDEYETGHHSVQSKLRAPSSTHTSLLDWEEGRTLPSGTCGPRPPNGVEARLIGSSPKLQISLATESRQDTSSL